MGISVTINSEATPRLKKFYHNTTMKFFIGFMAILALAVLFIDDASAVQCGGYTASSCEYCPYYQTQQCSGDCYWKNEKCVQYPPNNFTIKRGGQEDGSNIPLKTFSSAVQQGKPSYAPDPYSPPANYYSEDDFGK